MKSRDQFTETKSINAECALALSQGVSPGDKRLSIQFAFGPRLRLTPTVSLMPLKITSSTPQ
jgi:hypothetical protein